MILTLVEHLRREKAVRGPLAGPHWSRYLLDAVARTNRELRAGQGTLEGEAYYRTILEQATRSIDPREEQ